ncbi:hotdog fold thioesterase [Thiotrichales bacterium 19S3-7]|nr:hotdog fold thioesterase [Thiotrichales bacterium 19S3-7]MCF6802303.1 hotdog fold thioesterase [Thiotrichales bacterium 19S3-11]
MSIWKTPTSSDEMNQRGVGTLSDLLGIVYTEVGDDYVKAEMPVTDKVKQPIGIMNGGASCVIAESVGSCAANYAVDLSKQYCVGLDINTNHIRAAYKGKVIATARPFHIGRTTQVWSIDIHNEAGKLVSVSRLTMAVKDR